MDFIAIMRELEAAGSAEHHARYRRHGMTGVSFGTDMATQTDLRKTLRKDQALAERLWATGVADARLLACRIADPLDITADTLEAWVGEGDHFLAFYMAELASKTPYAVEKMERWLDAEEDWITRAGWMVVTMLAMDHRRMPDSEALAKLDRIEREMPRAANRVREAMNEAMIAIGLRNRLLEAGAIASARRIGKIRVDHGDTGCRTPDAETYIRKARKRRNGSAAEAWAVV